MTTTLIRRALTFLMVIALWFAPYGAPAADPYEINVILPLTGFAAFVGQDMAKTLAVVEDVENRQGGINGQPIHFVVQDDQSTPQIAVQLTNALLAKHASFILGSAISAMCEAQAPLVKDGPVLWCISPIIRPAAGSYIFTTLQTTDAYIEASLRYAMGRGWRKLAIITTTDTSGHDYDTSFDRVIARPEFQSLSVVARDKLNVSDISAAAQVAHVKGSGANVLFAWTTGTAVGTVLRNVQDAGLDLPTFTNPANGLTSLMLSLQTVLPTNFYFPGTAVFSPNLLPAGPVKQAIAQYTDALRSHGVAPDQSTLASWDPPLMFVQALRKLGANATATQIRDALDSYRGPGAAGMYDFPKYPQRGLDASSLLIVRWDKAHQDWSGVSKFGGSPL